MRRIVLSAAALGTVIAAAAAVPALAANTCRTETLTCPTTMPVDGYCECTARGRTEDGTVVAKPPPGRRYNSTAGGCGAQPNAPGCR